MADTSFLPKQTLEKNKQGISGSRIEYIKFSPYPKQSNI
jgi:hypothetical protein